MGLPQVSSVAVILVNWNGYPFTAKCLRTLAEVGYKNFSVIVVDNGSTDGSLKKLKTEFPNTVHLENKENLGFTGGNNTGISYALESGFDAILLLNNDTEVRPDFLEELVDFQNQHPDAGMVQPLILFNQDRNVIWSAGGKFNKTLAISSTLTDRKAINDGFHPVGSELDWATGCCILIPAAVVREVGFLPESYFAYFEDVDWSLRVREKGYKIYLASQSVIFHEAGASSKKKHSEGTLSATVFYLHSRNQLFQLRRYVKFPASFVAWPFHLLKFLGWMSYFCLRGRFQKLKAVSRGILDGMKLDHRSKTPLCP